jgi:hypothetical protein
MEAPSGRPQRCEKPSSPRRAWASGPVDRDVVGCNNNSYDGRDRPSSSECFSHLAVYARRVVEVGVDPFGDHARLMADELRDHR